MAFGLPFFIGGGVKAAYDVILWLWFRRVPIDEEMPRAAPASAKGEAR